MQKRRDVECVPVAHKAKPKGRVCIWGQYADNDMLYSLSCRKRGLKYSWTKSEIENFKYCPYCGKPVKVEIRRVK